jgi:hypothetical protein
MEARALQCFGLFVFGKMDETTRKNAYQAGSALLCLSRRWAQRVNHREGHMKSVKIVMEEVDHE